MKQDFSFKVIIDLMMTTRSIIHHLLFLSAFILAPQAYSYEKADAFIVKIYDEKVRVLSPSKFDPKLSAIIENKTHVQVSGKVETHEGEVLSYVRIEPGKSVNVSVKKLNKTRIFFISLSPPLQKVELKLGNKPYEIPPQK